MTIEAAIRERLLNQAPVTALVGERVFLLKLPQSPTLPAVRVALSNESREGQLRGPDGMVRTRVQVDAFDREGSGVHAYTSVSAVADAVHGDGLGDQASGLAWWRGVLGGSPAMIRVLVIRPMVRRTMYEGQNSPEDRLVRMQQDFMITWTDQM